MTELRSDRDGRGLRISARVSGGSRSGGEIWFAYDIPAAPPAPLGDPFLAAALVPAMTDGANDGVLVIDGPVSTQLTVSAETIQDILTCWYRDLHRVEIRVAESVNADAVPAPATGVAAFFSGGVDSWFTALKHRGRLTHLLTVLGFDVQRSDLRRWNDVVKSTRVAADAGGSPLLATTNMREILKADWGCAWHGAALAAVALGLQSILGRVLIAATYAYDEMRPRGSHPLLDPLWSTSSLSVVHDGAEANRMEKVDRIAQSPAALSVLRVCYKNRGAAYNCCRCEKCSRTMIALRLAGGLDRAVTFPERLDLRSVLARHYQDFELALYNPMLARAEAVGDRELVRVLRKVVQRRPSVARFRACAEQRAVAMLRRWPRTSRALGGVWRRWFPRLDGN